MSRVIFLEDRCKGCLLCVTACPAKIIVQAERFNAQGYKVAEVPAADMDKCTGCASCALICPDFAVRVLKTKKAKKSANAEEA